MYMYGDSVCPDLDLLRLFIMLLYGIGWKGGSFFPTKEELANPPADGVYKTSISEDSLYKELNHLFRNVLGRDDKLSCHSGKKTGYLFAVLRGVTHVGTIMAAACHTSVVTALLYLRDALAVAQINRIYTRKCDRLGPFKSPFCQGNESAVLSCQEGNEWQVDLKDLVKGFMEERVGVKAGDPRNKNVHHVYEKVMDWVRPEPSNRDKLSDVLSGWSEDRTDYIMACVNGLVVEAEAEEKRIARGEARRNFSRLVAEKNRELQQGVLREMESCLSPGDLQQLANVLGQQTGTVDRFFTALALSEGTDPASIPHVAPRGTGTAETGGMGTARKKRKTAHRGVKEFPHRQLLPKKGGVLIGQYLLDYQNMIDDYNAYINKDKQFLNRMRKPLKCLRDHCGCDPSVFGDLHGDLKLYKFNDKGQCQRCSN